MDYIFLKGRWKNLKDAFNANLRNGKSTRLDMEFLKDLSATSSQTNYQSPSQIQSCSQSSSSNNNCQSTSCNYLPEKHPLWASEKWRTKNPEEYVKELELEKKMKESRQQHGQMHEAQEEGQSPTHDDIAQIIGSIASTSSTHENYVDLIMEDLRKIPEEERCHKFVKLMQITKFWAGNEGN